ncbi:AfsR/SARP family transcriptional regulator [Streptomyces globisporus]|uniref:AfsR/SARP family transcriptional regulator n=1 Tax=Streptomyces globisporus TaxID=1908 RepID=UPI0004CB95F6|nr:AfsR/SARP family transcriptional regulator [Streptomyces globisporus]
MRFRILGPLEVVGGPGPAAGGGHTPGPPKLRAVLGTLLARAGEVVPVSALIDELWPDGPPRTAVTTLHVYVSQVRKGLSAADPRDGRELLETRRPGYVLHTAPGELDLAEFETLRGRGRAALDEGDHGRAAVLLRRAEDLWRGPFLSGTPYGPLLASMAARLEEARLDTVEHRIRADLGLGRGPELVTELRALTTEHPLREELQALLITALHRGGRLAEALHAYAQVRRRFVDELGAEPGPRLRALHQELLNAQGEPASHGAAVTGPPRVAVGAVGTAAELPAPDGELVGRERELARLMAALTDVPAGGWTAVTGPPGSGKTALAVAAARRAAGGFPDGVLFLALRPDHGPALAPGEAAARLLRRAGVRVAPGSGPLEALRAWTAARRMLLVLDDAPSVAHVRPLLPLAGSTALVTGRLLPDGSAGLRSVPLGPLGREAAAELLAAAGPAAAEIARLCDRLPLALRAAALQLSARPHWTGETLAARLRDDTTRLDVLRIGELDVRERLTSAYEEAPPAARGAFRLLGVLPPGGFRLRTAAAVLDLAPGAAAPLLECLVDHHLLTATAPDTYAFPELLRVLAADRLGAEEPAGSVRAATVRMCEAHAEAYGRAGAPPVAAGDVDALTRVVRTAHAAGLWPVVVRLADALTAAVEGTAAWNVWEETHALALDAARRLGDGPAQARLLRKLGDLAWQQRETGRSAELYGMAARCAEEAGQADERARALAGLAELRLEEGRVDRATELLLRGALDAACAGGPAGRYEVRRVEALLAIETEGAGAAVAPLTECLALASALGDRRREAYARRALRATDGPQGPVEVRPGVWRLRGDRRRAVR